MEKLIELLNEYENYLDTTNRDDIQVHFRHINWADVKCFHNYSFIISKRYLFIKWLVDNDKINREGMKGHGRLISYCLYIKSWERDKIKEGVLLMLLAIQDSPIEFLCSIIK